MRAMIQASKFTPDVMLSAPRRSGAVPNLSGVNALYTVSTYSFQTHSKTSQIRVMNVEDGTSRLISEDLGASDPIWISDNEVAYLKASDNGCTTLMYHDIRDSSKNHMIHHFAGSISNPKAKILDSGKVVICCAAVTTPSGDLYWPAAESKSHSTAKIYDALFVRHWDTWATENHNSLWYGKLEKKDDKWTLESPFLNLLAGTKLASPIEPFGGTSDFDIGAEGIAFVAKDPEINPARYTKSDVYYVKLDSFTSKPSAPRIVKTGKLQGYSNAVTFANDGKKLAFLRMKHIQYESDKSRLLLIPSVHDLDTVQEFYETSDGKGGWDSSPDSIIWNSSDDELYVTAEKHGNLHLWKLPASPAEAKEQPKIIFTDGCVGEAHYLRGRDSLLVSSKSRVENSKYSVLNHKTGEVTEVSSSSKNGKSFGLHKDQCSDIWFTGAAGYDVHALITKPSDFDPSKKYPLAFIIHGGPQNAFVDDWSTRWNPAIYAEQGYIAVCPNFTGSSGYGQDHTDAIADNWGGLPYEDLVKCFEYLEKIDYIDTDRAVALGASYGGYMINWIQGHDLGRKFKCLVCHDGVFSTLSQTSTEELFFSEHDFGGTFWENREGYSKWDPAQHVKNWDTPMLVIHNELDYRLTVGEGLSMFNMLQSRGVPSKLVVFPDENHWVLKPENSLVWHREVLSWINKWSGISKE